MASPKLDLQIPITEFQFHVSQHLKSLQHILNWTSTHPRWGTPLPTARTRLLSTLSWSKGLRPITKRMIQTGGGGMETFEYFLSQLIHILLMSAFLTGFLRVSCTTWSIQYQATWKGLCVSCLLLLLLLLCVKWVCGQNANRTKCQPYKMPT